jgi:hypothetical protein
VASLRQRPQAWIDFMMRFELGLEKPNPKRALISAATIAGADIVGGFIPLVGGLAAEAGALFSHSSPRTADADPVEDRHDASDHANRYETAHKPHKFG